MAEIAMPFGDGTAVLDDADGTVVAVRHPHRAGMTYLLDDAAEPWHTSEQRWGKGFVITDRGAGRWDAPAELTTGDGHVRARYELAAGLELGVERRAAASWTERYVLRNAGSAPVRVLTLGVYVPFRDVYRSAADALRRAVHAHVWPGGSDSWVVAQPMDGAGPVLGLRTTAGSLWAYSVESREPPASGSDVRGHLVLHPTDAGRAPHAFGGQPVIALAAGEEYELAWELAWWASSDAFFSAHPPLVSIEELSAACGRPLTVRPSRGGVTVKAPDGVDRRAGDGTVITLGSQLEGERHVEVECQGRASRVTLHWHAPLSEVVRRRVRYILDRQRAVHRSGSARGALLPLDTQTGLTVAGGAWSDFSDARERIGMGLLLQRALARGWVDDEGEVREAVDDYRRFLIDRVLTGDGRARSDSHQPEPSPRLYDLPWLMLFLLGEDRAEDAERAKAMFDRYHADGGTDFLAIGMGLASRGLSRALRRHGGSRDADAIDRQVVAHARRLVELGPDLPAHEVSFEQSMVAPLLEILCVAASLTPSAAERAELTDAIARRVPWLLAFGGAQPHVRMRDIAIRHWDGYWFGRDRLWGDVFPHHWSALTANVLVLLPPAAAESVRRLRGVSARRLAARIYAANLVDFRSDGTASAAFVMPSCVSGRPAHAADPIANDQDWALYWPLHLGVDL